MHGMTTTFYYDARFAHKDAPIRCIKQSEAGFMFKRNLNSAFYINLFDSMNYHETLSWATYMYEMDNIRIIGMFRYYILGSDLYDTVWHMV